MSNKENVVDIEKYRKRKVVDIEKYRKRKVIDIEKYRKRKREREKRTFVLSKIGNGVVTCLRYVPDIAAAVFTAAVAIHVAAFALYVGGFTEGSKSEQDPTNNLHYTPSVCLDGATNKYGYNPNISKPEEYITDRTNKNTLTFPVCPKTENQSKPPTPLAY